MRILFVLYRKIKLPFDIPKFESNGELVEQLEASVR
jgi:hypothetical protein